MTKINTIYDVIKNIEGRVKPVEIDGVYISEENVEDYKFLTSNQLKMSEFAGTDVSNILSNMRLVNVNGKYILQKDEKLYKNLNSLLEVNTISEKETILSNIKEQLEELKKTADYSGLYEIVDIYNAVKFYVNDFKNKREVPVQEEVGNKDESHVETIIEPVHNNIDFDKSVLENINIQEEINEKDEVIEKKDSLPEKEDINILVAKLKTLNPNYEIVVDPVSREKLLVNCDPDVIELPDNYIYDAEKGLLDIYNYNNFFSISKMLNKEDSKEEKEIETDAKEDNSIKNSTDVLEIVSVIRELNPNVDIIIDPINRNSIYCDLNPEFLILPNGFEYNKKNGITNKHHTDNGLYIDIPVKPLLNKNYVSKEYQYKDNSVDQEIKETTNDDIITSKKNKVIANTIYTWKDKLSKKIVSIKGNVTSEVIGVKSPIYNTMINELDDIIKFTQYNGADAGVIELERFSAKIRNYREDVLSFNDKERLLKIADKYKESLSKKDDSLKL